MTAAAEPAGVQPLDPQAFSRKEIRAAALRPDQATDMILAGWRRLGTNVALQRELGPLLLLLLCASLLSTLPYGAVLGWTRAWRIAVLFVGSMAICFPSLQVFGAYLGFRVDLRQNLVLALIITAVAGLFTFGFFPILWFLDATLSGGIRTITANDLSAPFLALSLLAGIGQQVRTLRGGERRREGRERTPQRAYPVLLFVWQGLLVFIAYRMSVTLELI